MWLIKTDKIISKSRIRHPNQTKTKKPLYIQLKIIKDLDYWHAWRTYNEKSKKSGLHKSPSLISPNHTSFIEDFPGTYGKHCPHTEHAYKHTFIHAHTKIHIKHSILREDPEANSFYLKKLDVFMPRWKLNQTPSNQAIASTVGNAYLLISRGVRGTVRFS